MILRFVLLLDFLATDANGIQSKRYLAESVPALLGVTSFFNHRPARRSPDSKEASVLFKFGFGRPAPDSGPLII